MISIQFREADEPGSAYWEILYLDKKHNLDNITLPLIVAEGVMETLKNRIDLIIFNGKQRLSREFHDMEEDRAKLLGENVVSLDDHKMRKKIIEMMEGDHGV